MEPESYSDTKGMNSSTKLHAACAYEHEQNCVTHQMLQHKANPLGGSKSQLICSIKNCMHLILIQILLLFGRMYHDNKVL